MKGSCQMCLRLMKSDGRLFAGDQREVSKKNDKSYSYFEGLILMDSSRGTT